MKRLQIDFLPKSWHHIFVEVSLLGWLAGCVGVAFCASAALDAWHAAQRHDRLNSELHRIQALRTERAARQIQPKQKTITPSQADAVNTAIEQLNLPWRDVLDAIEAATPSTIALITLEPDAKKHQVRGQAEANSSEAMIAYVEQLKLQSLFDVVTLTRHEVNAQDPNRPIRFQFDAHWTESQP